VTALPIVKEPDGFRPAVALPVAGDDAVIPAIRQAEDGWAVRME
jgi:hypothetical protein